MRGGRDGSGGAQHSAWTVRYLPGCSRIARGCPYSSCPRGACSPHSRTRSSWGNSWTSPMRSWPSRRTWQRRTRRRPAGSAPTSSAPRRGAICARKSRSPCRPCSVPAGTRSAAAAAVWRSPERCLGRRCGRGRARARPRGPGRMTSLRGWYEGLQGLYRQRMLCQWFVRVKSKSVFWPGRVEPSVRDTMQRNEPAARMLPHFAVEREHSEGGELEIREAFSCL